MQHPRSPFTEDVELFARPGSSYGQNSRVINADDAIRETDSDAAGSRLSAVSEGYLADPFVSLLHRPARGTQTRRAPLINVGTHHRTWAIDRLVDRFLRSGEPGSKKQIVSLGAGSDTRFWRLMSDDSYRDAISHYVELDFAAITTSKSRRITQNAVLTQALYPNGSEPQRPSVSKGGTQLSSPLYSLVPLDLRDPRNAGNDAHPLVSTLHTLLDPKIPTLLLAECVFCYMTPEESSSLLASFAANYTDSMVVLYEMCGLSDQFGVVMKRNLAVSDNDIDFIDTQARGLSLPGAEPFSNAQDQAQRFLSPALAPTAAFEKADALTLWQIRKRWIPEAEMKRLSKLEMLDELEELELVLSHYCVAWAARGALKTKASNDDDSGQDERAGKSTADSSVSVGPTSERLSLLKGLMDSIDWWALLNAPPQSHNLQNTVLEPQISVANLAHDRSCQPRPHTALEGIFQSQGSQSPPLAASAPHSAYLPSDSWTQQRDAELLSFLAQIPRSSAQSDPPPTPQLQAQQPQQSESAFQGLPEWLFPPAITPEPTLFPTVPAPLQWTTYQSSTPQQQVPKVEHPPFSRARSRGSSASSTPVISRRASPVASANFRYSAYSPTQLQEISAAELHGLSSSSGSGSIRPLPSRSASLSDIIEPEDAEDKRSRNTQASARFRAKKKQQSQVLQRGIEELQNRHAELERDVHDLRRENGFLMDMVTLKWGSGAERPAGVQPASSADDARIKTASTSIEKSEDEDESEVKTLRVEVQRM